MGIGVGSKNCSGFPAGRLTKYAGYAKRIKNPSLIGTLGCRRCGERPGGLHPLFFAAQRNQGIPRSPLFSCPGFSLSMVVIDMLHACDLGVSQIALGNLFCELLPTFGINLNTGQDLI